MVKDVLVAGVYDIEIRREILSTDGILDKSVNEIISLVEAKESARNALPGLSAAMSSFKKQQRAPAGPTAAGNLPSHVTSQMAPCPECKKPYALYTEGSAGWNSKPHSFCIDCFQKQHK